MNGYFSFVLYVTIEKRNGKIRWIGVLLVQKEALVLCVCVVNLYSLNVFFLLVIY